ncbi:hypothetical protein [Peptacetobacter hiranonis]|uniref:hypothetical protein n=1 Tax=Peptacetobacter hiranonis TaxID=89152 RepID=UPI003D817B00
MDRYLWNFDTISAIQEVDFHKTLSDFYTRGIDGVVRENIQNSMDAKLADKEKVIVSIKCGEIDARNVPGIDEIKERIHSLEEGNMYARETIEHMKDCIEKDIVKYISFEDSNTKGLSGAQYGRSGENEGTWQAYAYKKGAHHTEDDHELEGSRGGSHGVGKIASNSASDIHTMFFANCDEFGNQHIGGTIQLIEHKYKDKFYRATGDFTDIKIDEKGNEIYYPFENNFNEIFRKDTRGLKIIIPFLREEFYDLKSIVRSVCDNFFIAILEGSLVVSVNDMEINRNSIIDIVKNTDYYEEQEPSEIKTNFTPLYVDTKLNYEPLDIFIEDKRKNKYEFKLYMQYNKDLKRGRTAIVRTIGMKIEDKKIKGHVRDPYNAVLIPKGHKEDVFLKSLENESHTALSFEHIKNDTEKKNANYFINKISTVIGEVIAEYIRESNPSDGKIDTSDILYSVINDFKKDLMKEVKSTVKTTKGKDENKKETTVIKTGGKKPGKSKTPRKTLKERIKEVIRRSDPKDGNKVKRKRVRHSMDPEFVKRLVLSDKEMIMIDFSNSNNYISDGDCDCDISLSVIDGEGKEYEGEFNIVKNYKEIIDKNTGNQCNVDNNMIKDISIVDGKIKLELKTTDNFNEALKFIYFVEV